MAWPCAEHTAQNLVSGLLLLLMLMLMLMLMLQRRLGMMVLA
jgi:hypothetical protein